MAQNKKYNFGTDLGSLVKHNALQTLAFKHRKGEPKKAFKVMIWISKSRKKLSKKKLTTSNRFANVKHLDSTFIM